MSMLLIHLPLPSNFSNPASNAHWSVKAKAKKRYYALADQWQAAGRTIRPPTTPIADLVEIRSTMYLGARMDEDNAVARHKWALDWLATRGYITNDRNLRWGAMPTQVIRRRETMLVLSLMSLTP